MAHSRRVACLFFLSLPFALPLSAQGETQGPAIEEKLVFSGIESLVRGPKRVLEQKDASNPFSVVFRYDDRFESPVKEIRTEEEYKSHKRIMQAHFVEENARRMESIALDQAKNVYASRYAPFIVFDYDRLSDFSEKDYENLKKSDSDDLSSVYIQSAKIEPSAERNSDAGPDYPFADALADIGIPTNKPYDGSGVKIGCIDGGLPNDESNLQGVETFYHGSTRQPHAFQVSSIFGGTSGIANGAEIHFVAAEDFPTLPARMELLIDADVHLINHSQNDHFDNSYTSDSAYIDYVTNQYKIVVCNSAGNASKVAAPATAVNSIAMGSCDRDGNISSFSPEGIDSSLAGKVCKPTYVAPGGEIHGVPNIGYEIFGTSISTPMATGVIALLMQEYPTLKFYPASVQAILGASTEKVNWQEGLWDKDAGSGRIHYQRAREAASTVCSEVLNHPASPGSKLTERVLTIPTGSTVSACVASLFRGQSNSTPANFNYLKTTIEIQRNGVVYGTRQSVANFSYLEFENDTPYTDFKIVVKSNVTKTNFEYDFYSLAWTVRT